MYGILLEHKKGTRKKLGKTKRCGVDCRVLESFFFIKDSGFWDLEPILDRWSAEIGYTEIRYQTSVE